MVAVADEGFDDGNRRIPSPYLTTAAATAYCGFKTASALRKAHLEGKVHPAGKRGGTGTWMWSVEDLDRFLIGLPPRDSVSAGRPGTPPVGGQQDSRIMPSTT